MITNFKVGDFCMYRTHGVAKIIDIETVKFGDFESKCLVLFFENEKMTLSVPLKFKDNGDIRRLCTEEELDKVLDILKSGQKKLKGMDKKELSAAIKKAQEFAKTDEGKQFVEKIKKGDAGIDSATQENLKKKLEGNPDVAKMISDLLKG